MVADIQVNDTVIFSEPSAVDEDQSKKARKFRDQKEEERIVKQFKILSPKDIELMLSGATIDKPTKKAKPQSDDDFVSSGHEAANHDEAKPTHHQLSGKKRAHEEATQSAKISDETSMDELLGVIRQRVLNGDTLNNFKKEINLLVDLIEKADPKMDRIVDQVGVKLASILQKSDQEMQMMLRRTHFMNKRKEKRAEIDKTQAMVKMMIEQTLTRCNAKPIADLPANFNFAIGEALTVIKNFVRDIETHIAISNRYFQYKNSEDRAKVSF